MIFETRYYTAEELKQYESYQIEDGLIVVANRDDWIDFGVMDWHSSAIDGAGTIYSCLWHGCGPSGSLRELRHSYFGSPSSESCMTGYIFYLNRKQMIDAMNVLLNYFDMD